MLYPNPHLYGPGGGYHFVDRSTGTPVRIDGDTYENVAARVLKFRLANGKPAGDPMRELIDYVCTTWPSACLETTPPEVVASGRATSSVAQMVTNWFSSFYRGVGGAADPGVRWDESVRRAEVCTSCPYNRPITGCGSCVDSINRLFFIWRRDRPIPQEPQLGGCTKLGQHNGVAALARNLPVLSPEARSALPERCWRKAP